MKGMNKKGISPVVATILLISLTLIIAAIIFIWARTFVGEQAEKFGEPIENSCEVVDFTAEAIEGEGVNIVNTGNVPLYGIEVIRTELGARRKIGDIWIGSVLSGETGSFSVTDISRNERLTVIPVILGEVDEKTKHLTCEDIYGEDIVVKTL